MPIAPVRLHPVRHNPPPAPKSTKQGFGKKLGKLWRNLAADFKDNPSCSEVHNFRPLALRREILAKAQICFSMPYCPVRNEGLVNNQMALVLRSQLEVLAWPRLWKQGVLQSRALNAPRSRGWAAFSGWARPRVSPSLAPLPGPSRRLPRPPSSPCAGHRRQRSRPSPGASAEQQGKPLSQDCYHITLQASLTWDPTLPQGLVTSIVRLF